MRFPYAFTTLILSGGKLVRNASTFPGASEFTVDNADGGALLHLHLSKDEAAQWAAVLTKYAEATK